MKTNSIVSKFVPDVNENCFNCDEKETPLHLLYNCVHTQTFLRDLNIWLTNIRQKYAIPINRLNILFGLHNEDANSERNLTIMVAKKFIWIQKFKKYIPTLVGFQRYFLDFLLNLKTVHAIKNDSDWFSECWDILIVHLRFNLHDG